MALVLVHDQVLCSRTPCAYCVIDALCSASEEVIGAIDRFEKTYGRLGSLVESGMRELRSATDRARERAGR